MELSEKQNEIMADLKRTGTWLYFGEEDFSDVSSLADLGLINLSIFEYPLVNDSGIWVCMAKL